MSTVPTEFLYAVQAMSSSGNSGFGCEVLAAHQFRPLDVVVDVDSQEDYALRKHEYIDSQLVQPLVTALFAAFSGVRIALQGVRLRVYGTSDIPAVVRIVSTVVFACDMHPKHVEARSVRIAIQRYEANGTFRHYDRAWEAYSLQRSVVNGDQLSLFTNQVVYYMTDFTVSCCLITLHRPLMTCRHFRKLDSYEKYRKQQHASDLPIVDVLLQRLFASERVTTVTLATYNIAILVKDDTADMRSIVVQALRAAAQAIEWSLEKMLPDEINTRRVHVPWPRGDTRATSHVLHHRDRRRFRTAR